MANILMVCNTYFQLILAIQMTCSLFKKDNVSLAISDHSIGTDIVAQRLERCNVFKNVYYVKTRDLDYAPKTRMQVNKYRFMLIFGCKDYSNITNQKFDKLFYYNDDLFVRIILPNLLDKNKKLECCQFEEGILSYVNCINNTVRPLRMRSKIIAFVRHLLGKRTLNECTNKFYCSYPAFYNGKLECEKIPLIEKNSCVIDVLQEIFNIKGKSLEYKQKYIFFTSVYDFEGQAPIGEFEIVQKIRDCVGNENLLIKTHPRDRRGLYEANGFNVDVNSSVPWEAIQLGRDFSDKVFITVNSGSVLSVNMLQTKTPDVIFIYKFCDITKNISAQASIRTIENLLNCRTMRNKIGFVKTISQISDVAKM